MSAQVAAASTGDETTAPYDLSVKRWQRQFTDVVSKELFPAVLWSLIGSYAVELGTFLLHSASFFAYVP
jgi:hypothetical protein